MDLREFARAPVICLTSNTVEFVHGEIEDNPTDVVVVVDLDRRPIGLVTAADIADALASPLAANYAVGQLMRPATSTGYRRSLLDAQQQMETWGIDHLPVLDEEGRVAGVLVAEDVRRKVDSAEFATVEALRLA